MRKKTNINITNAILIIDEFVNKPDNKKISDWEDIYDQLLCIAGRNKKCKAGSLSAELKPSDKKKIIDFAGKGCGQFINAISSLPCVLKPVTKMLANIITWKIAWFFGCAPEKYAVDDEYVYKGQFNRIFYGKESLEEAKKRQLMIWQARSIAAVLLYYGINENSKKIIKKLMKFISSSMDIKVLEILRVPVIIKLGNERKFNIIQYLEHIGKIKETLLQYFI